jgi:hypothetical protein
MTLPTRALGRSGPCDSVFRSGEADRPLVAKDNFALVRIEHSAGAQLSRRAGKAAGSTDDVDSVTIACNRVDAGESTNLRRRRYRVLQIYRIAGVCHPMMVHFCDDTITSRCDAEDVDTECSCEISGSGSKSRVNELLPTFAGKTYGPAFSEKVSDNSPANLFTVASVTIC